MSSQVAYLLVFHGSHDPRSQQAAKALTQAFEQAIQHASQIPEATGQNLLWEPSSIDELNSDQGSDCKPSSDRRILVQDAYLECFSLALHQQIAQFAQQAFLSHEEIQTVVIVPVFLLAGVHVMEDIPAEVALAQPLIGTQTTLKVMPHFGSHLGLHRLITERISAHPLQAWILLAHGSRYPGANQAIEELADKLGAIATYWSTEPKLETRIQELATAGLQQIGIFPYFLFSGAITEAIEQTIFQISQRWPQLALTLTKPLEDKQELANLLVDFTQKLASQELRSFNS